MEWLVLNLRALILSAGSLKTAHKIEQRVFEKHPKPYQEMLAALRPLTLFPPLNTVQEIMRGMFELFYEVAKAGGILRVRVLLAGVCVVIQDATSDK